EALTVVEAQDAEARRRMPPENRQVRLERRVEETDRLAARIRDDGERFSCPLAHAHPLEGALGGVGHERRCPAGEIQADPREPVAPAAPEEPATAVVGGDAQQLGVEYLEVEGLRHRPAAGTEDLGVPRVRAGVADPAAHASL